MNTIIPRWEWRTFGTAFGAADAKFAALTTEKVQESDEIYLLSPLTDANVKIRAELMDLKTLEQVSAAGLEQWRPVMKASFPLGQADVGTVCTALGVPPPTVVVPGGHGGGDHDRGHGNDDDHDDDDNPGRGGRGGRGH